MRQADAVFVAEVQNVFAECEPQETTCGRASYANLNVTAAWKGIPQAQRAITVFLPHPEACGFDLKAGETYLVYAGYEPPSNWGSAFGSPAHGDLLTVSSCSRTVLLKEAASDLQKLGHPLWQLVAGPPGRTTQDWPPNPSLQRASPRVRAGAAAELIRR